MRAKRPLAGFLAFVVVTAAVTGGLVVLEGDGDGQLELEDTGVVGQALAFPVTTFFAGAMAATAIGSAACSQQVLICTGGANSEEMEKADALETKKEIYKTGSAWKQSQDQYKTVFDNWGTDMKTVARMVGKNAYIRSIENGTTNAVAVSNAKENVSNWFSARQKTVVESYNSTMITVESQAFVAENTTNVGAMTIDLDSNSYYGDGFVRPVVWQDSTLATSNTEGNVQLFTDTSDTLINGSSVTYRTIHYQSETGDGAVEGITDIVNGSHRNIFPTGYSGINVSSIKVMNATSSFEPYIIMNYTYYEDQWEKLETMNQDVQDNMDVFNYTAGDVNASELIDPYLAARNYSPDAQFGTWSVRQLAALGYTPPENMSSIGKMDIIYGSETLTGILLDGGEHTFEEGETYNATNLSHKQYFSDFDSGKIVKLDGGPNHKFTLSNISSSDETDIVNISYSNPDYNVTTGGNYSALMEELNNLSAEINGWQQALRATGGGGLLPNVFGGIPGGVAGAAAGVGVLAFFIMILAALVAIPPRRRM